MCLVYSKLFTMKHLFPKYKNRFLEDIKRHYSKQTQSSPETIKVFRKIILPLPPDFSHHLKITNIYNKI